MGIFLTHLEVQGFKSFAGKTDFEFKTPVTGIVGPNGSGKSNVIDAIRWVLGEREAKNLRGESLDKLVFAGTAGRGPASLARVTLRFNNHNKLFPLEGEEISVSRRIDRSGISQFYVNNQEVRLKDLISMLAKARMGSRGFAIIGQGDADVFVRVSPQERREMIEEVLGLKEFRLKKRTAERQLSQAIANMDQLEASLKEIEPHLRFLKRQKNKWEKREEIEEEMNQVSRKYFAHHYNKFTGDIRKIEEELKSFEEKKSKKAAEVKVLRDKIGEESNPREEEMKKVRVELEELRSRRIEAEKEAARVEAKLEYMKEREEEKPDEEEESYSSSFLLSNIKSFVGEAERVLGSDEPGEIKGFLRKWFDNFQSFFIKKKKEEFRQEDVSLGKEESEELEKIKERIGKIDNSIKESEKKENEILSFRDEESRRLRDLVDRLEDEKDLERKIEDEIREKETMKERTEFRLHEIKNKWEGFGFSIGKLEELAGKSPDTGEHENWGEIERKIGKLSSKLSVIGEIDEALVEEARETEERYDTYTRELEDLKKASADLKKLIKDLEEKIHGTFKESFSLINKEFNNHFRVMFGGGKATLRLVYPKSRVSEEEEESGEDKEDKLQAGVEISLNLPKKKISGLDMLSGGEKTLVSVAALFSLVSVSPPPFLVLDEIDAALDDKNTHRFSELIKDFSEKTQFIIVTHNKITMEVAGALYGVTMGEDGASKVLSLKFEDAEEIVE